MIIQLKMKGSIMFYSTEYMNLSEILADIEYCQQHKADSNRINELQNLASVVQDGCLDKMAAAKIWLRDNRHLANGNYFGMHLQEGLYTPSGHKTHDPIPQTEGYKVAFKGRRQSNYTPAGVSTFTAEVLPEWVRDVLDSGLIQHSIRTYRDRYDF